jgi:hypothetical protein
MKKWLLTALAASFILTLLSCDPATQSKLPVITVSGSAQISLNGTLKKYAQVSLYRTSDCDNSGLLGTGYIFNSTGNQDINDIEQWLFPHDPDGTWKININLNEKPIPSPLNSLYLKVRSSTNGVEGEIIHYPATLFDRSIDGIDLDPVDILGTEVEVKVSNITVLYHDVDYPADFVYLHMYRRLDETHTETIYFRFRDGSDDSGEWTFVTGPIEDTETIYCTIEAQCLWGEGRLVAIEEYPFSGATVKAGLTLDGYCLEDLKIIPPP